MSLRYLKRVPLWRRGQNEVTLNLSLPSKRNPLPLSLSLRLGRVTWNTRRGFSSVRLGRGLTWMDRD